ncbi:MBL fold metallo-hydrolase [Candidatus Berkelbacteria bacterium]|nr:MBL fold metallo-hydrolase [Candidatus Berkelbacteria bacterium]
MLKKQLRFIGIAILLISAFAAQLANQPSQAAGFLRVVALDIGQGDAILITTPDDEQILVDGGPSGDVVGKILHYTYGKKLDLVVATHNDADHIGGLPAVVNSFKVNQVWINGAIHTTHTYESWLATLKENQVSAKAVKAGESLRLGQVELEVLYPTKDYVGVRPELNNDATIVIRLTYGATSFLLTGDLEQEGEEELIRDNPTKLGSTVLKVSHHGSGNSSAREFLDYVHPELALISVGEGNRYGHPAQEVIDRLEQLDIESHRTDKEGDLVVFSDGAKVWFED